MRIDEILHGYRSKLSDLERTTDLARMASIRVISISGMLKMVIDKLKGMDQTNARDLFLTAIEFEEKPSDASFAQLVRFLIDDFKQANELIEELQLQPNEKQERTGNIASPIRQVFEEIAVVSEGRIKWNGLSKASAHEMSIALLCDLVQRVFPEFVLLGEQVSAATFINGVWKIVRPSQGVQSCVGEEYCSAVEDVNFSDLEARITLESAKFKERLLSQGKMVDELKESLADPAEKDNPATKALNRREQEIDDILPDQDNAMRSQEILGKLARKGIHIDRSTLSRICKRPHMQARGVRCKPGGAGYYKIAPKIAE